MTVAVSEMRGRQSLSGALAVGTVVSVFGQLVNVALLFGALAVVIGAFSVGAALVFVELCFNTLVSVVG